MADRPGWLGEPVQCPNCPPGAPSKWVLAVSRIDEHGNATLGLICSVCHCVVKFKITRGLLQRFRYEGLLEHPDC
jgi:hypothetical protein